MAASACSACSLHDYTLTRKERGNIWGNVVKSRKVKPRAAFKTGKVGKVWKERGKVSKEELASKGESIKARTGKEGGKYQRKNWQVAASTCSACSLHDYTLTRKERENTCESKAACGF